MLKIEGHPTDKIELRYGGRKRQKGVKFKYNLI